MEALFGVFDIPETKQSQSGVFVAAAFIDTELEKLEEACKNERVEDQILTLHRRVVLFHQAELLPKIKKIDPTYFRSVYPLITKAYKVDLHGAAAQRIQTEVEHLFNKMGTPKITLTLDHENKSGCIQFNIGDISSNIVPIEYNKECKNQDIRGILSKLFFF